MPLPQDASQPAGSCGGCWLGARGQRPRGGNDRGAESQRIGPLWQVRLPPYLVITLAQSWSLYWTRIVQTQVFRALSLFAAAPRPCLETGEAQTVLLLQMALAHNLNTSDRLLFK